jgi:hypothetical protein
MGGVPLSVTHVYLVLHMPTTVTAKALAEAPPIFHFFSEVGKVGMIEHKCVCWTDIEKQKVIRM